MDAELGKILASYSLELAKGLLSETGSAVAKKRFAASNVLKVGINKYLDRIYASCSKTKTLLYVDKAIKISDIYVNGTLRSGRKQISDDQLLHEVIEKNGKVVISGTAGSGKSMMMKHFVLEVIRKQSKKLPIFFELRSLNIRKGGSLLDSIYHSFSRDVKNYPREKFDDALRRGMFIFIFDGFDEVDEDLIESVEVSLRELYKKNDKNTFIISSRPDPKLNSSIGLDIYHVQPLSKRQVISLIDKVNYDPDQKEEFKRQLEASLYDDHKDFASSPLLVTMMLLTFHHFSIIPEKIHIFYAQVFEVLYSRHDVSKEGHYVRDFKTSLPMDDFSSILEALSSLSYIKGDYDFSPTSALSYSEKAINYVSLEVDKRDFVSDMLKCVCLFVKDGGKIKLTHRSFQEYFTALFIGKMTDSGFEKFAFTIMKRIANDNVLHLLFAMHLSLIHI